MEFKSILSLRWYHFTARLLGMKLHQLSSSSMMLRAKLNHFVHWRKEWSWLDERRYLILEVLGYFYCSISSPNLCDWQTLYFRKRSFSRGAGLPDAGIYVFVMVTRSQLFFLAFSRLNTKSNNWPQVYNCFIKRICRPYTTKVKFDWHDQEATIFSCSFCR